MDYNLNKCQGFRFGVIKLMVKMYAVYLQEDSVITDRGGF